jgi:uncharacterized protein (DUF2147 family)
MRSIAPYMLAAILAGVTPGKSWAQEQLSEDELVGEWVFPGTGSMIRAHRCGDIFCDANAKVDPPKRWDSAPKPRVPSLLIPANLRRQGARTWRAEFLNIRDGETHEGTITLVDKNRLTFVRCLIGSVFCETVIFHRIVPPSVSEPPKQPRAASPAQPDAATSPLRTVKAQNKPLAKQPTRADFEAFFKERGAASAPVINDAEQQVLFKEYMAWRSKR